MNKEIEKIIKKNQYRSNFYHHNKKPKKTTKFSSTNKSINKIKNKSNKRDYTYLISFANKVLISIFILFILLISKKDSRLSFIYKTTFRNMNFMKIEKFVDNKFSGLFPKTTDDSLYVNDIVINIDNSTTYRDGVIVETPIYASIMSHVEGIVIKIYNDDDLGKVVVIQDINGYLYHYGYLDDIKVRLFSNIHYGEDLGIGKVSEDLSHGKFYLAIEDGDDYLNVINIVNNED